MSEENPDKDPQKPDDDRDNQGDDQKRQGDQENNESPEKNPPENKAEFEPGPPPPAPAEPSEAGWNFLYVVLAAMVIVSLVMLLGIVSFGTTVNAALYIITLVLLAVSIIHWAGAW